MGALLDRPLGTVKVAGGTAGTPAGGVTSIQGVAGGTPVPVSLALASAAFQATGTVPTAGTRVALASNACTYGFYVTNTHATAIVYLGVAATVSSSAFIHKLYPGQSSPRQPFSNSNLLGIDADTNGATVSYGGG